VGTLGGVETFGLVGLFVGPVIMAAVLSLMREWLAQEAQLLFPLVLGRNFACV
jgi:predicted PurR-regulated permease PerM